MTTITIPNPPLPFSLPIPRDADHAAYIINRALAFDDPDESFFMQFIDAIVESGNNPAIDELYRILSKNDAFRTEILLSIDFCPSHDQDIDSCCDDFDYDENYCEYADRTMHS